MLSRMNDWELVYYETATGDSPVEDYLRSLPKPDGARAARELNLLERQGTRLEMPHVRPIQGTSLWELRIRGRIQHRVFYVAVQGRRILLLHAFMKKSQKTPLREIDIAQRRFLDYQRRTEE